MLALLRGGQPATLSQGWLEEQCGQNMADQPVTEGEPHGADALTSKCPCERGGDQ